ncbi:MAG TPA: adenosine kinase [Nitrososphaerales archaeon]
MKEYAVFGIGNALVDFLLQADDDMLKELNLEKGRMHLIDEKQSKAILEKIKGKNVKTVSGGSSANTLAIMSILGSKVVFCGKVGHDEYGSIYETEMVKSNVKSSISKINHLTGHAITFITPDYDRTFTTCLGAALYLNKGDIIEHEVMKSTIVHIEGYQLEGQLRETIMFVMDIAKQHGAKISIDLSDSALIRRNLDYIRMISKTYADILFANENEAEAFTGLNGDEALEELSKFAEICILKLGEKGSMIKQKNNVIVIESFKTIVVDSTGAGDAYAAGFLHGICSGMTLEKSGQLASFVASKVISQVGSRLTSSVLEDAKSLNLL